MFELQMWCKPRAERGGNGVFAAAMPRSSLHYENVV